MRYSTNSTEPQSPSDMKRTVVDAQEHPIEAVTVYMFRAEVRRIITLELKQGRNDLAIINLPSSVAPDTLHVAGLSAGQASIVDTTCVGPSQSPIGFSLFGSLSGKVAEKVVELEAKRRELLRELSLINARSDVLLAYARTLGGENTAPEDFVGFLAEFNEVGQATLEASTRIESAIQAIDDRIRQLKVSNNADEDEPGSDPNLKTKASVVISAKEACTAKLSLTYVVNRSKWTPVYKLYATTDTKTHAVANNTILHYCASITQTTGEDWNDVRLTLSTRGSSGIQTTPNLPRSFVRAAAIFGDNNTNNANPGQQNNLNGIGVFGQAPSAGLFGSTLTSTVPSTGGATAPTAGLFGSQTQQQQADQPDIDLDSTVIVEPDPEMRALDHVGAQATEQALSSTYSIDTRVTVENDGTPHRVTMMTLELGAKTEYVAVPKINRSVYLLCKITNTSAHQFLPGLLVTYLDNSYVDSVSIPFVPVKGTIVKSLGTDTALSTTFYQTRKVVEEEHSHTFARKKNTIVTDVITLKNARSLAIPRVLVRHAIPVPNDPRFRVTIKQPEDLGELRPGNELNLRDRVQGRWMDSPLAGGEITGRLEWAIANVTAHATEEIKMVYEVTAPEDVNWTQT